MNVLDSFLDHEGSPLALSVVTGNIRLAEMPGRIPLLMHVMG